MNEKFFSGLPKQRVSNSEKVSDKWYIPTYEYWISQATGSNDKGQTRECLEAANGIISDDTYKYVQNPLDANEDKLANLPGIIRNVDFLTPIKEKNIGEYIELPYRFLVTVNNPDTILLRNEEVREEVVSILEQQLVNLLNKGGVETDVETRDIPDIEEYTKKFMSEWFDDRAIQGQKILKLINNFNDSTFLQV